MAISVLRAAALSFGVLGFSVFVGGCRYREGKTWTETRVVYTLASGSCPAQLPLDTESIRSGSGEVLDAELISTGETITQADLCWYELAWGDSVASAQMRDNFRCSKQSTLAAARSHYVHYSSEVPRLNAPEFEGRGSTRDGMLYPGAVGCVDGRRVYFRTAEGGVCRAPTLDYAHFFSTEVYLETAFLAQDPRADLRACKYHVTYETSGGLEPDFGGMQYGL